MNSKQTVISVTVAALAAAALIGVAYNRYTSTISADGSSVTESGGAKGKKKGAVPVELFVMSQCPYGVQAMGVLTPVLEKMGGDVDFSMQFIGSVDSSGKLSSMHGESEVTGDIAQLCAAKHAPDKYLKIIACQNENVREVATNWEACATKLNVPVEPLKKCVEGPEGKELLTKSFRRAEEAQASGSPTFLIGGKPYEGRRTEDAITRAICAAHTGKPAPAVCAALPEQPKVNVTVLSDKRCKECDSEIWVSRLKSAIANPVVTVLDYGDENGRKMYDEIGGGQLPTLVFDETFDKDKEASATIRGTVNKGKYRILEVGRDWLPRCADPNGCQLEECKTTMACRPETPNTLELFVMSQCPYGVMALNAMPEVLKNFGDGLKFNIHYIASGTAADGFNALHGQPEVDENIRQLCVAKLYPAAHKYMDYITCRNENIRSEDWKSCTGKNGIVAQKIEACVKSEGAKLHEEDIKIGNSLGIGASPSWVANGKFKFSGIDAETVRKNVCEHNKDLKGCENKLSGGRPSAAPAGGCGN